MDEYEEIYEKALFNYGNWIYIKDDNCRWTIEDFPYSTGVDQSKTMPHCAKCVAINRCYFVNENDKMPIEPLNDSLLSQLFERLNLPLGNSNNNSLYHINCHCKKEYALTPKEKQIKIIEFDKKMDYAIKDKLGLFLAFGYTLDDVIEISQIIKDLSIKNFCLGNYLKADPNEIMINFGFKININISFPGKNLKSNKIYNLKSCFMIFPNYKLKTNTPIGGWSK